MNESLHYDSYLHILDEEMIPTQGRYGVHRCGISCC
jgi:hypothetical protein